MRGTLMLVFDHAKSIGSIVAADICFLTELDDCFLWVRLLERLL